jgi:hypothetical protein
LLAGSLMIEHVGWFSGQSLLGGDRRAVGDND